MQYKVLILLSSYNGEKYIREQIDSILNQEDVNLHILIRDDGSSDNTVKIIYEYQKQNEGLISLIKGENVGWRKSFFNLIKFASERINDYDYFAFCDQDDIWLPEKLSNACTKISTLEDGKPRLYCSNLYYYKNGENYGLIKPANLNISYKNCLILNYATGCTIVFDRNLLDIISHQMPEITVAHDQWAYMVAVLCGNIIFDSGAYILYRQHDGNQIGATKGILKTFGKRLGEFKKLVGNHEHEIIARELHSLYSTNMSKEARYAVQNIMDYRSSLGNWLRMLFDNEYTSNRFSSKFWLKIRIFTCRL